MKLYRSDDIEYLYVLRIKKGNLIYFGNPLTFNIINSSDRRRSVYCEEIDVSDLKQEYLECVDKEKLKKFNTVEALEYYILYNKVNLKDSLKDYCIRFGVYVKNYSEYYTGE